VRLSSLIILGAASVLSLAGCSHDSNTLTVSPPLPPAEEPSDETPGAYVADAGANTPAGNRAEDEKSRNNDSADPGSGDNSPGGNDR
jgi:hypothetical protein